MPLFLWDAQLYSGIVHIFLYIVPSLYLLGFGLAKLEIPKSGFISVYPELCHGCGICELACSLAHDGVCSPNLSRIRISRDPLLGDVAQEVCWQCFHPDCYLSCPFDAIIIDEKTGARVIVEDLCTNCGICSRTCPLNRDGNIIKAHPSKKVHIKCDLCSTLNRLPLCVEVCPWEALKYIPSSERRL
jgi:Fe-S-cluster-containing hydrogenase component 2